MSCIIQRTDCIVFTYKDWPILFGFYAYFQWGLFTLPPPPTSLLQTLSRDHELEHLCRLLSSTMLQIQAINMTAHLIPTLLSTTP